MPLWTRCGTGGVSSNHEGGRIDGAHEVEGVGGGREGGGGSFEGLVRNVASLLTDTVWGYFRPSQKPTSAPSTQFSAQRQSLAEPAEETVKPDFSDTTTDFLASTEEEETTHSPTTISEVNVDCGLEKQAEALADSALQTREICNLETTFKNCSNAVDDIDEVLSSTLGALYGRATPAAVKQAWEVLSDSYLGDVSRFKTEFLNPVLELLHRVQEIQDTGEFPNSTWPLSVGSSVVVHLSRKNCRYLQDIGDFCINAILDVSNSRPGIVVSNLTFDGIVEREVDEQEFGSLLTMDWARKVREAADHELVFVLRQCMVASEYAVRRLRWDEIPQLDPRNLRKAPLQIGNSDFDDHGKLSFTPSLNCELRHDSHVPVTRHAEYVTSDHKNDLPREIIYLSDTTEGESSTDYLVASHNVDVKRSLDDTAILTNSHTCSVSSGSHSRLSLVPSDSVQSIACSDDTQDSSSELGIHDSSISNMAQLDRSPTQLSSPEQDHISSTHHLQSLSSKSGGTSSASSYSGTNYYGTWHGSGKRLSAARKIDLPPRNRNNSASGDVGGRHVGSDSVGSQEVDAGSNKDSPGQRSVGERSHMEQTSNVLACRQLDVPELISQVDSEILSSGVAILPGCMDEDGRHLVYIFTCSSLWHERRVSSTELARLLMYYYTVPRKKSSEEGMAIVADIRGATPPTINILLEALNLFQENIPGSVAIVHLFADKSSQSYMIRSPLYDAKANVNLKAFLTLDHLQQYVHPSQIPTVLDGDYPYNHESWVRFRKKLELFMCNCRAVACHLVDIMQEISSSEQMPQSVTESSDMIRVHEQTVKLVLEDERLLTLQSDGPAIISALRREEESFANSEDYSFAMEQATELHEHLEDTVTRLIRLADEHLTKLHNCLQLREYEDECHKVIDWLSQDGETILQKHTTTADNLKAARHQQKDFEKFYYSAVSYIEKGNDLLEEASMLSQCGSFSEATGYKDLAKTLRKQLQNFTGQLEETRERIEGTAKCYNLLDKSYEWALEAMKYVSSLKMEHSTTAEGLDKLLKSLNIYLSEHPPIPEESFVAMLEAAQKLSNSKLVEQCKMAKARCQETQQLLQLRQTTLKRARNQMEVVQAGKEVRGDRSGTSQSLYSTNNVSRPMDGTSQAVRNNIGNSDQSSSASFGVFLYPNSVKGHTSTVKSESGDGVCVNHQWEPQGTSTPTFCDWQGAGDIPRVAISAVCKSKNSPSHSLNASTDATSGASPLFQSPAQPGPCHKSSPNTNISKIHLSSSFSSPLPSSSSQYIPTSMSLPMSPTLSASETPSRTRLYQPSSITRLYSSSSARISTVSTPSGAVKSAVRRPSSHPGQPGTCDLSGDVAPPTRPHKKILKRASTAPVPMLTSPIIEEETGPFSHPPIDSENSGGGGDNEGSGTREQRRVKSISVITSSTESLSSMPEEEEEDEADLEMSPSHNQNSNSSVKDWTPIPVNTHLHRSARGTPTGPMADLRLSEAEIKSRRTVSLIMSEMIQTERDYVRALQFITDHYVPELQRDDVPQMLRGKRTVIFGNLEKIHQFHSQYFLKQMETCQNQPFLVGQYFLQHETMFYLYALYNKNKPKSDSLMFEYGKEFFRQKQLELGDKMDLSSYLLKPVQRMGKYALLLKQLLKECPETELEYPELKAAEEMVKFQLRHGNDLLAMDSLREYDVNLQEQGRLIRQEEFLVFQGRKKSMRRIFLFEDLILFSKTRRGRQGQHDIYIYKTSFKTADIGLTENYGDSGYKFEIWFRRRSVGENYVLQAPSSEVKKAWVKDISRLLWRQAIRNRESRINELATMGIGNKPCLDIKPSVDNIQDRSINVLLANRGARTRNSIAVSSFDYLRNGNKRPHSIISVSSTSSSGSSQSSFGLVGSLNLAFDPLDSPRLNRRSYVSNESGIVADIETSGSDLGLENRGPTPNRHSQTNVTPHSSVRSYFDVMKSRVLKQKYSDQLFTDV